MENHAPFMKRAIALGAEAAFILKSGGPFGAVIVKDGKIIAEGWNRVIETKDPTRHAEMEAIRKASEVLGHFKFDGCILYTSSEPCPMCLSACYWAGLSRIYYASGVVEAFKFGNFDDSFIYEELIKEPSMRSIPMEQIFKDESLPIWKKYQQMEEKTHY